MPHAGEQSDRFRVLCAVGTRPEVIKLAPVIRALQTTTWAEVRILATGQHREMLDQMLAFFEIEPNLDLELMQPNQDLADLTGRLIGAIDAALARERPDMLLAQGDTTTVMASALCCFYRRIPFAHVEAGLRTGNRFFPFPEEMNRSLTARLAALHFAPTQQARRNLLAEGIPERAIEVTGNTVIDALLWTSQRELPAVPGRAGDRPMILVTAHRRESFGAPLEEICGALVEIAERRDVGIVYPVHPNPNVRESVFRLLKGRRGIQLSEPLDYPTFVAAMKASHIILTDSGGVQEEAPSLHKPVLILRDETERPEGVAAGLACIVGPHRERIVAKSLELLDDPRAYAAMAGGANPYGDGQAAGRIRDRVERYLKDGARSC